MTRQITVKDCIDHTARSHWKNMRSYKTSMMYAKLFMDCRSPSTPIKKLLKGDYWIKTQNMLLEDHPRWTHATVNRTITAARTAINKARKAGLHEFVLPEIDKLKENKCRMVWLTRNQVDNLANVAEEIFDMKDLSDAILVSAYTGIRQDELLKLRVKDLDQHHKSLHVGGMQYLVTKANEIRHLPIGEINRIWDILTTRCAHLDSRDRIFGDCWRNGQALRRQFYKVRDYCGLDDGVVWHTLRHSYGTWLAETESVSTIQALMGHASAATTERYVKVNPTRLRTALSSLNDKQPNEFASVSDDMIAELKAQIKKELMLEFLNKDKTSLTA